MSGRTRVTDNRVTQAVQPGAPAGRYTVTWRVTSIDGHRRRRSPVHRHRRRARRPPQSSPPPARTLGRRGPRRVPSAGAGVAWWVYGVGAAVVTAVAAAALTRRSHLG